MTDECTYMQNFVNFQDGLPRPGIIDSHSLAYGWAEYPKPEIRIRKPEPEKFELIHGTRNYYG